MLLLLLLLLLLLVVLALQPSLTHPSPFLCTRFARVLASLARSRARRYALDTKRVMIKLRCPPERLEDVAEVLRMKLKTRDGTYMAFRESVRKKFLGVGENVSRMNSDEVIFKSSERQKIIDFIIRSRIRDSGAELDERNGLGKNIEMRMPLHMHARLEGLFSSWVTYWSTVNWEGDRLTYEEEGERPAGTTKGGGGSAPLVIQPADAVDLELGVGAAGARQRLTPPNFFFRLFKGAFHQPLDAISNYYGESVAFYFAWLQHSAWWLVAPAFLGTIQFIVQTSLGDWDPVTRPFFALFIMFWSFAVMVTWRQRSNFLAHRWGTLNYEEEESTRPQYKGDYVRCDVTGEWIVQ
jgi:hypothetical protein